jgi:hypothetical protein
MFESLLNKTLYRNKYHTHPEAVVISCYFNSEKSPYRLSAFKTWYESIKHLNHRIIECVIGDGTPELGFLNDKDITVINTPNLLWHKEAILNKIISELPEKFEYVFWVDADVIFTNLDWLVDGVKELQTNNIVQPFEYCVHLEKGQSRPTFNMDVVSQSKVPNRLNNRVWRSFSANFVTKTNWDSENYNDHGHVGFAWGARRDILEAVPLYDKALIGGADHIMAHAAVGQIPCSCITKAFTDNLEEINEWSHRFAYVINGKLGYVKGNLFHIWHGDIEKRQYLKRIQDFTSTNKNITERDEHGLHVTKTGIDEPYIKQYFQHREEGNKTSLHSGTTTQHKTIKKPMTKTVYNHTSQGYVETSYDDDVILPSFLLDITEDIILSSSDDNDDVQIETAPQFDGFDGGSSGGAGATGTWDNNDNFS